MYIHFSHQNDVPCFYVQQCSCFVPPALEDLFFLYDDTQYVCAQGKGIRVLLVFDLVRIPHWNSPPQPPPTPLLVRYCKNNSSFLPVLLFACSTEKTKQNKKIWINYWVKSCIPLPIAQHQSKPSGDFVTCWVSNFIFCMTSFLHFLHWLGMIVSLGYDRLYFLSVRLAEIRRRIDFAVYSWKVERLMSVKCLFKIWLHTWTKKKTTNHIAKCFDQICRW